MYLVLYSRHMLPVLLVAWPRCHCGICWNVLSPGRNSSAKWGQVEFIRLWRWLLTLFYDRLWLTNTCHSIISQFSKIFHRWILNTLRANFKENINFSVSMEKVWDMSSSAIPIPAAPYERPWAKFDCLSWDQKTPAQLIPFDWCGWSRHINLVRTSLLCDVR